MKYLTHILIKTNKFNYAKFDFICVKCNVILYCINGSHFVLDENEDFNADDEFNLTCEEYIIKSIIE